MGSKAYFLINVDGEVAQRDDYCLKAIGELEAIAEVECVEPVSGIYDLMVKANVPIRTIFVADKILEKAWVRRLHVLKVEEKAREPVETVVEEQAVKKQVKGTVKI